MDFVALARVLANLSGIPALRGVVRIEINIDQGEVSRVDISRAAVDEGGKSAIIVQTYARTELEH